MTADGTQVLAAQARADLALLSYPSTVWVQRRRADDGTPIHAVVIIGGGQSGLAIAAALRREGVDDVVVVDRQPRGCEGVWETFARMGGLRTPKGLNGIDFGCPSLSVQRWFDARFGDGAWGAIDRVPRTVWMDYLRWYRETLGIAVENDTEAIDVRPAKGVVAVDLRRGNREETRLARVVVIASGYDGAGRWEVPDFVTASLPPGRYDHTNGPIDFARFVGLRVAVLGHAASAFDNAIVALQSGALSVDLCFRRERMPRINPHRYLETAGTMTHFAALPDAVRWRIACFFRAVDQPPPATAFAAACAYPNFRMHPARPWTAVRLVGREIVIETPKGELCADHLLLGTGATVALEARAELRSLAPVVLRWRDCYAPPPRGEDVRLAALPYLDRHFGFLPKGQSDGWVERVICYNAASYVSHGPHSTSISGHRHCLPRVVRGVTKRLFREQEKDFLEQLMAFRGYELDLPDDFESTIADGHLLEVS
jgi:cation diffusion facilitator CzcD-associated flavoprotein CzcO